MKILGPVFGYELVTSSRQTRFVWLRVFYVAALLSVVWGIYEVQVGRHATAVPGSRLAEVANTFFWSYALAQLLTVLFATPPIVAGTIAEEKERRTLEYLLTTDLRNTEIVLGKLSARVLHVVSLLAAGVPVLAITMLLGGVPPDSLVAVSIVTLATLLAASSMSVWCSVRARRGRDAIGQVFALGTALLAGPPLISTLLPPGWGWWAALLVDGAHWASRPNPLGWLAREWSGAAAQGRQSGGGSADWIELSIVVGTCTIASLLLITAAVWQLRRVYIRQTYGEVRRRNERRPAARFRPGVGDHAMLWKELFSERPANRSGVVGRVLSAMLLLGLVAWMLWAFVLSIQPRGRGMVFGPNEFQIFVTMVGTILGCVVILGVSMRAAAGIAWEREHQTWDLLLSTPLEPREIIWAKLWGCLYGMRWVLAVLALMWGLAVVSGQLSPFAAIGEVMALASLCLFGGVLGLTLSLRLGTSMRATAATFSTYLFVGGGYLMCCVPLFAASGPDEPGLLLSPCVPVILTAPVVFGIESGDRTAANLVVGAVMGGIGYLFTALAMLGLLVNCFDEWSGRPRRGPMSRPPAGPQCENAR